MNEEQLKGMYHRAWLEANRGFVEPRKYPYLDAALTQYAMENNCSYDQALMIAKKAY